MSLIFVYGTLRLGESISRYLDGNDTVFVHRALTHPIYTLRSMGHGPLLDRDGETAITGEIYDVGPACLVGLDAIEGWAYDRRPVSIDVTNIYGKPNPEERIEAYFVNWLKFGMHGRGRHTCEVIPGGDWVRYRLERERRERDKIRRGGWTGE